MRTNPPSSRPRSAAALAVLLAAACFAAGCVTIEPPAGYAPLPDPGDKAFLAVSPKGSTFAMSERKNLGGRYAGLDYWVEAFQHEKVTLGGYRLAGGKDIETAKGLKGRVLDLRLGEGAAEYTWLVAIFVRPPSTWDPGQVVTVEAGGPSAQIGLEREKIEAAIRTLP